MSASAARGDVPLETSAPGALRSPHGRSDDKKQNDLSYLLYLEKKDLMPIIDPMEIYLGLIEPSSNFILMSIQNSLLPMAILLKGVAPTSNLSS